MLSAPKPMRPLRRLMLTEAQQQIQERIHEHDAWIARLVPKYGLPRAALVRMLDRPGALEDEIAAWIVERARDRARALFADDEAAPMGDDLYTRAVCGLLARLRAAAMAVEQAARMREARETDDFLRRLKSGEEL